MNEHDTSPVEETALATQPPQAALVKKEEVTVAMVRRMEAVTVAKSEVWNKIALLFWGAIQPGDLINMGGKPYLQGVGAMRGAGMIGLTLTIPQDAYGLPMFLKTDIGDGDYTIAVAVTVEGWGREHTDVGAAQSATKFYRNGAYKDHLVTLTGSADESKASEHDRRKAKAMCEGDVRKKSLANAQSRAVLGWLGMRGLTWDAIKKFNPDLTPKGAGKVEFKKGSKGGGSSASSGGGAMQIASKYENTKCRTCNEDIAKGDKVWYDKTIKGVACGKCGPGVLEPDPKPKDTVPPTDLLP